MKLITGARIGQSPAELMAAILFSSFFHLTIIAAALFIVYSASPRVHVPPFYNVKLVDLPVDLTQMKPMRTPEPAVPPAGEKAAAETIRATKLKAPAPAARAAAPRDAMPELGADKAAKEHVAEDTPARPETARRQEAVAVTSGSTEFRFPPYVAIVRDKVERNWNPPPGAKGVKVKVVFKVLRSGRVGDARLAESSGSFYFDQAAMRAILSSSPFPPLPEGFFRESETFSVDLMERE